MQVGRDFQKRIEGYGLLTAEILYHMPDYPKFLQSFLWQTEDKAPNFPELNKFLGFWEKEIDGTIHSVRIAHQNLIKPMDFAFSRGGICLH